MSLSEEEAYELQQLEAKYGSSEEATTTSFGGLSPEEDEELRTLEAKYGGEEPAGWLETIGTAGLSAYGNTRSNLASAARATSQGARETFGDLENIKDYKSIFSGLATDAIDYWLPQENANKYREEAQVVDRQIQDELNLENSPNKQLAFNVTAGITPTIASLATGPLAPYLLGASAMGDQYSDLLEQGVDPTTASQNAGLYGIGSGIIERYLPFNKALQNKGLLTRVIGTMGAEGAEETLQGGLDVGLDYAATGKPQEQIMERTFGQFIPGAIGGGVLGGARSSFDWASNKLANAMPDPMANTGDVDPEQVLPPIDSPFTEEDLNAQFSQNLPAIIPEQVETPFQNPIPDTLYNPEVYKSQSDRLLDIVDSNLRLKGMQEEQALQSKADSIRPAELYDPYSIKVADALQKSQSLLESPIVYNKKSTRKINQNKKLLEETKARIAEKKAFEERVATGDKRAVTLDDVDLPARFKFEKELPPIESDIEQEIMAAELEPEIDPSLFPPQPNAEADNDIEEAFTLKVQDSPTDEQIDDTDLIEIDTPAPDGSISTDVVSTNEFGINDAISNYFKTQGSPPPTFIDPRTVKFPDDSIDFKSTKNPELKGKTRPGKMLDIVGYVRLNGDIEVRSGRHRTRLAIRNGDATVPFLLYHEADGYTEEFMQDLDAELNILDGQGSVKDVARFARKRKPTREEASEKGLLARQQGKIGFDIGLNASDNLYGLYTNDKLKESHVHAIVSTAPNNDLVQQQMADFILNNKDKRLTKDEVAFKTAFTLLDVDQSGAIRGDQMGIFPDDEPTMMDSSKLTANAIRIRDTLDDLIRSSRAAAKDPESFTQVTGKVFTEEEGAKALSIIKELETERAKYDPKRIGLNQDPEVVENIKTNKMPLILEKLKKVFGDESGFFDFFGNSNFSLLQEIKDRIRTASGRAIDAPGMGRDLPAYERKFSNSLLGQARQKMTFFSTIARQDKDFAPRYNLGMELFEDAHAVNAQYATAFDLFFSGTDTSKNKVMKVLDQARVVTEDGMDFNESPENLAKLGLSPNEIKMYETVRKNLSGIVVDNIVQGLKLNPPADIAKGGLEQKAAYLKAVDVLAENYRKRKYIPITRDGNYMVSTMTPLPDGRRYFSTHDSMSEVRSAIQFLKDQGIPEEEISHGPLVQKVSQDEFSGLDVKALADLATFSKTAERALQERLGRNFNVTNEGFLKHLQEAKNFSGYKQEELAQGLAKYLAGNAKWYAQQRFTAKWSKLPAIEGKPTLIKQSEDYYNYLKKATPEMASYRKAINSWYLSRPASSIVNALQNFTTTIPLITSYVGAAKSYGIWFSAAKDFVAYSKGTLTGDMAKGMKIASERGTIGSTHSEAMSNLAYKSKGVAGSTLDDVHAGATYMFNRVETFNTGVGFAAGWRVAEAKGLTEFQDKYDFARKFRYDSQFDNSKATKPEIARGGFGASLTQFRLFQGHMLRFLRETDFITSNKNQDRHNAQAFVQTLAHGLLLGGVRTVPFMAQLLAISEAMGIDIPEKLKELPDFMEDTIMYGLPSELGVTLSGNLSSDLAPGLGESWKGAVRAVGGVALDEPIKLLESAEMLLQPGGNNETRFQAFKRSAPPALRGPLDAYAFQSEGVIRDKDSQDISSELFGVPEGAKRAAISGALAFGFNPTIKQKAQNTKFETGVDTMNARDTKGINKSIAKAIVFGNQEQVEELFRYAEENNIKTNDNSIEDYIKKLDGGYYDNLVGTAPKNFRGELDALLRQIQEENR